MMRPVLYILASVLLLLSSCNEDDVANITVTLVPLHNGEPIEANEIVQDASGRNFKLSDIRFYITDISLVRPDGSKVLLEDLALVEWPGVGSDINMNIPKDLYSGLEFHIGLDPATNLSNPDVFEDGDPLSAAQDMHLGDLGYVFLELAGSVDTSAAGGQAPSAPLQYRLARDTLYTEVDVDLSLDITGTIIFFSLVFEVNRFFSGPAGDIDIRTERINFSAVPDMNNALTVVNNFAAALEE